MAAIHLEADIHVIGDSELERHAIRSQIEIGQIHLHVAQREYHRVERLRS